MNIINKIKTTMKLYMSPFYLGFVILMLHLILACNSEEAEPLTIDTSSQITAEQLVTDVFDKKYIVEGDNLGAGNGKELPDWAKGWTHDEDTGFSSRIKTEKEALPTGELSENLTLDNSKTYTLNGSLIVPNGITFSIPEGTIILVSGGTASYIAVAQGGKIMAEGTKERPIVFTSAASSPEASSWGGIVLCGKAPSNKGASVTAEVSDLTYAGTVSDDNSGTLKYVRIEYTGATFSNEKEFNGLSLFGVGSGTIIEYIETYKGGDDGIEFFGGLVNGKYLVSSSCGDDGIDYADGWGGTGSYWYIKDSARAGIEGSNNGDNGEATPLTNATLENISVVVSTVPSKQEGGFYFKEGTGNLNASNLYISGYPRGIYLKYADNNTVDRLSSGDISINPIFFDLTESEIKIDVSE